MERHHVLSALQLAQETEDKHTNNLQAYPTVPLNDSEDDAEDSEHPIVDSFMEIDQNDTMMKMTSFSYSEFIELYNIIHEYILKNWNVGKGRRSNFKPCDFFFYH